MNLTASDLATILGILGAIISFAFWILSKSFVPKEDFDTHVRLSQERQAARDLDTLQTHNKLASKLEVDALETKLESLVTKASFEEHKKAVLVHNKRSEATLASIQNGIIYLLGKGGVDKGAVDKIFHQAMRDNTSDEG